MCTFPVYLYLLGFFGAFPLTYSETLESIKSESCRRIFFLLQDCLLVLPDINCFPKANFIIAITFLVCCCDGELAIEALKKLCVSTEATAQALRVTSLQEGVNLNFQGQLREEKHKKKDKE